MTRCVIALSMLLAASCSSAGTRPVAPTCDEACREGVAVRGVRETMKLGFNIGLQGKPVGSFDVATPCPLGGTARIVGDASSNAEQGATFVNLTYTFNACGFSQRDDEPDEAYSLVMTGSITQQGVIAVQPTATTALVMASESMTIVGSVYDPSSAYEASACPLRLGQSGNRLSGTLCGRAVGIDL